MNLFSFSLSFFFIPSRLVVFGWFIETKHIQVSNDGSKKLLIEKIFIWLIKCFNKLSQNQNSKLIFVKQEWRTRKWNINISVRLRWLFCCFRSIYHNPYVLILSCNLLLDKEFKISVCLTESLHEKIQSN